MALPFGPPAAVGVVALMLVVVGADVAIDRSHCADELVALATCLQYVSGSSKIPTPDCCSGLKEVLRGSPKCLCLLIKDHEDPSLGLKIEPARAMSLPENCHASANISQCPKLLHLPPGSPDAKIFKDFEDATHAKNGSASGDDTGTVAGTSALRSGGSSGDSTATKDSSGGTRTTVGASFRGAGGGRRCQGWGLGLQALVAFWIYWALSSLLLSPAMCC